jgi:hypothetical protein
MYTLDIIPDYNYTHSVTVVVYSVYQKERFTFELYRLNQESRLWYKLHNDKFDPDLTVFDSLIHYVTLTSDLDFEEYKIISVYLRIIVRIDLGKIVS